MERLNFTEAEATWLSPEEAREVAERFQAQTATGRISLAELAAELKTTPDVLAATVRSLPTGKPKSRHWSLPSKKAMVVLAFITLGTWTVYFGTVAQTLRSTSYRVYQPSFVTPEVSNPPPENFSIRLDASWNRPSLYLEGPVYDRPTTAEFLKTKKAKLIQELTNSFREEITNNPSEVWTLRFKSGKGDWIILTKPDHSQFTPYRPDFEGSIRKSLYQAWSDLIDQNEHGLG